MDLKILEAHVIDRRAGLSVDRCLLVGISGIDASGKGFICQKLADRLETQGHHVALINADRWLSLPHVRFAGDNRDPGRHFYENGLRLSEMFQRLVLPLKRSRTVDLMMDFADETATDYHPHRYAFTDVDIILLEGIFLFKRQFASCFDLKVWIDCRFETALARAIERKQEGLSLAQTITSYETIYFPAQRHHFKTDHPRSIADIIVVNDQA